MEPPIDGPICVSLAEVRVTDGRMAVNAVLGVDTSRNFFSISANSTTDLLAREKMQR